MTDQKQPGKIWAQRSVAALKKIKGNRAYALTQSGAQALAALCKAYHDWRGFAHEAHDLNPLVERLTKYVPSLLQDRGTEPDKPPEIPVNIFGQKFSNPWRDGSLAERAAVHKYSPKLAEH